MLPGLIFAVVQIICIGFVWNLVGIGADKHLDRPVPANKTALGFIQPLANALGIEMRTECVSLWSLFRLMSYRNVIIQLKKRQI
ncbi:hypothetical protein DL96DRAFT_1012974 [Flagelloscypha sp. PMI_526]|nr:hypothetical protein DL96DRAFT_1012974 [Flagelloscypha sp. PMI_526]